MIREFNTNTNTTGFFHMFKMDSSYYKISSPPSPSINATGQGRMSGSVVHELLMCECCVSLQLTRDNLDVWRLIGPYKMAGRRWE